jgi:hypothetical protein
MFIMPHPVCNYVHRIMLQFYVCFSVLIPHVVNYFFPDSPLVPVVHAGLLEVPMNYLGSLGYFLAQGPVLLNGYSPEKLMLMGSPECAACLA